MTAATPLTDRTPQPFFETAATPMAVLSSDGNLIEMNAAWSTVLADASAARGKRFLDLLDVGDVPTAVRTLGGVTAQSPATFDARLHSRATGALPRPVHFSATRAPDGRILLVGVASACGRADDALRLSLLDRVLASAPVVLWALDAEGNYTAWEGSEASKLGGHPGELVGKSCLQVWRDSEAFPNVLRALSGEELSAPLTVPGPLHYDVWYMPTRDASGKADGMVGFGLDVTRQREAETKLREQLAVIEKQNVTLQMFSRVLESAPLVLWAIDGEGTYTMSEGKGLELLGFEPGESVGLNALEMFKDHPEIAGAMVHALAGEESRVLTTPAPGVHFENWYMPLRHQGGDEVYGVMGLALDASDRVRGERELRDKLELIERQSATIRALATPIIQVWDEVLCLPVIGTVDSARTAEMMQSLLESIVREQARFAIVDLTGVEVVDTSTADHLIQLFRAAKVLGVDGILCGIRPAVAQTVVALGLELGSIRTMRSLRDALRWCIRARNAAGAARTARLDGHRSARASENGASR